MTKLFKSISKNIITFLLVFTILFQSLYFNPKKVDAALPAAATIAGYVYSIIGAIDLGTGGSVRGITGDLKDALTQKINDLMGDGIYEDGDGNIVFSGSATQQIYQVLMGSGAYNSIVCSNFPISPNFQPPITLNNFTEIQFGINSVLHDLDNILAVYGDTWTQSNGKKATQFIAFDITNVAYLTVSYHNGSVNFYFKDKDGRSVSCPSYRYSCSTVNGTYMDSYSIGASGYNRDGFEITSSTPFSFSSDNVIHNNIVSDLTSQSSLSGFNYNCIYSRHSLIVATDNTNGSNTYNQKTGVTVNNYYSQIPKVKTDVVNNNNWNNIYNNYVQNVYNNNQTYGTGDNLDTKKLRQVMEQYGSLIYEGVQQGFDNIEDFINTTNEWLNRIYVLLQQISSKLDDDSGGSGGTVSGSTVDLSNIESYLQSLNTSISAMQTQLDYIKNNLPDNEQQLSQIYTVLTNIYQSLQNLPSGGVTDPDSDPYQPWYPKFFALPDADILDTIGQIQVIEALLAGLVPLCYVTGLGAVVNALGVQPVTPVFTIPVEMNNPIMTVDEDIEIDLSMFEDVRDYIVGGEVILFMLSLGYFTIWLLKFLLDILGKN